MRPGARWTAGAVLAAVAIVAALLAGPLTRSEPRTLASNLLPNVGPVVDLEPGDRGCQDGETIPADAEFILLQPVVAPVAANGGPLAVTIEHEGRVVDRTTLEGPFRTGPISAPIAPRPRELSGATICVTNNGTGPVALGGFPAREPGDRDPRFRYIDTPAEVEGRPQEGRMSVEFPVTGNQSALQMAGRVNERAGLFKSRAIRGWALWGGLALLIGGAAAGVVFALRRRIRLVAVAVVATAAGWAFLTPSMQVPDEIPHYGHAAYLAETGERPVPGGGQWIPNEEMATLEGGMPWGYVTAPFWTESEDAAVQRALRSGDLDRTDPGQGGFTNNVPPLYYLTQAVPYTAASSGTLLDRLLAMRLWSALLLGVLVLLVHAFIRTVLPRAPLAAPVGALAVGLHPVVGHISGGVSPDPLLWIWGTATFLVLAQAFRHGLTPRRGAILGLVLLGGLLTKPAMMTLAPGVAVALALLLLRSRERRRTLVSIAATAATALIPFALWLLVIQGLFGTRTAADAGFASVQTGSGPLSLREFLSYLWQFYLPPLDFMHERFFPGRPVWDVFFQGWAGRFGWFAYDFGERTDRVVLGASAAIVVAALATVGRWRGALRGRWGEALAYVALFVGVVVLVNAAGYRYLNDTSHSFEQTRYLFPALLPLYGLAVGLAVHALGRRWAAPLAAFLLTLLAGHALGGQLLTADRFYL